MRSTSTPAVQLAMTNRRHLTARDRVPRGPLVAALATAAAAGVLAGCGSGNGSAAAASGSAGGTQPGAGLTISSRQVSGVGTVLTDQSGKTLYTPEQEANGTIKCTGSCLSFWFPVTVANGGTPHAGRALAGKLGSIQRPDDGSSQVTYNGEPLYTFKLDSGPGQAHGNDFTDSFGGQSFVWHAAAASGTAPAPAPSSNPSSYNYQGGGY